MLETFGLFFGDFEVKLNSAGRVSEDLYLLLLEIKSTTYAITTKFVETMGFRIFVFAIITASFLKIMRFL